MDRIGQCPGKKVHPSVSKPGFCYFVLTSLSCFNIKLALLVLNPSHENYMIWGFPTRKTKDHRALQKYEF